MKKLPKKSICTGCAACVDACKHNALEINVGTSGFYVRTVTKSKCVNCGMCEKVCPVINKLPKNRIGTPYIAVNSDTDQLMKSSSGGVSSALCSTILKDKGIVVGVSLEDNLPKHIIVDSIEDISLIQGSKYLQSNCQGIYRKVANILKLNKKVLFSGTPCQVAALYTYLGAYRIDVKNLYTLEVICHGVPSFKLLELLQSGYNKKIKKIISFRNKENGWNSNYKSKLLFEDGTVSDDVKKIFTYGFIDFKLIRSSCLDCKFRGIQRQADVTCGDFWGIDQERSKEFQNGCSIMIVNSMKASSIIKHSTLYLEQTDFDFLKSNSNLICSKSIYKYHPLHILLKINFKILNPSILRKLYCNEETTNFLVRFIRYVDFIYWKLLYRKRMRQFKKYKKYINENNRNINDM